MKKKTYLIYANSRLVSSKSETKASAIRLAKNINIMGERQKSDYPIKVFEVSAGSNFKEIYRINYLKEVKE